MTEGRAGSSGGTTELVRSQLHPDVARVAGTARRPSLQARTSPIRGRDDECMVLEGLVAAVRTGLGQALVLRGEAGIGKTALLEHLRDRTTDCTTMLVAGVESEIELPYARLQQLCAPITAGMDALPGVQRDALATAFGLQTGRPPDRFLVGLAVVRLLATAAAERPVICVVDDAQWLDRASEQALAFVARRVPTEGVALVFAVQEPTEHEVLAGLPELFLRGVANADARALLGSTITGPVDEQVRERVLAEARGNPRALLELSSGFTSAELAAGFGGVDRGPGGNRLEHGFARTLDALPRETRRALLTAAAEPVGDPSVFWRALELLGIDAGAVDPARSMGLIEIDTRVRFRHPLVRSAAYRSASLRDRQEVHAALAVVTDRDVDADRRARHRALAARGAHEGIASDLVRSAERAHVRGGIAAAAQVLDQAATLTPDPAQRADRHLAAAGAKREAGALDDARRLIVQAMAGPPDARRAAEAERLRGHVAFDHQHPGEAARLLGSAARRLEALDVSRARETHLERLVSAIWASSADDPRPARDAASAALAAPTTTGRPGPADLALDALAVRVSKGYAAAAPAMVRALAALDVDAEDEQGGYGLSATSMSAACMLALEVWDFEAAHTFAERRVERSRDSGALVQLQFGLDLLGSMRLFAGETASAARAIDEDRRVAEATGHRRAARLVPLLAALRGDEADASSSIDALLHRATTRGQGRVIDFVHYSRAVLNNGLGRYEAARDAAQASLSAGTIGWGAFVVAELAEAASRTRDDDLLEGALGWVVERTRTTPTDWALGIEARVRALLADGEAAADHHRQSIERLRRTPLRVELGRGHLLYGEWLRREGRRIDARTELRAAHELFTDMGLQAFAERARRELQATGETVRRRTVDTSTALTPQEAQIARLAGEGRTNPEIGEQLFISARTVEWHLRKVYAKLGVTSRRQLREPSGGARRR